MRNCGILLAVQHLFGPRGAQLGQEYDILVYFERIFVYVAFGHIWANFRRKRSIYLRAGVYSSVRVKFLWQYSTYLAEGDSIWPEI